MQPYPARPLAQELERRYYGDGTAPQTQAEQDFTMVSEQLKSRCRITLDRDPAEYETQINEVCGRGGPRRGWNVGRDRD